MLAKEGIVKIKKYNPTTIAVKPIKCSDILTKMFSQADSILLYITA